MTTDNTASNEQANASKKVKTPPPHKNKLNFYCHRTFAFAAYTQANAEAKAKEPNFPTLYFLYI